jgi:hypothetical protein
VPVLKTWFKATAMMIDLNRFPADRDIHTLADFVELMTLVSPDRLVSRDDFDDYIRDLCVDDRKAAIDAETVADVYAQLAWRQSAYGSHYPFATTHSQKALSLSTDTSITAAYIYLLICANIPLLADSRKHHLFTDSFERFAGIAIANWWCLPAQVKPFGKGQSAYLGSKWERLNSLAKDLGGHGTYNTDSFRNRDIGDGGIDHVAWRAFDNYEQNNKSTALFQCACSRADWPRKQSDASYSRLSPKLHVAPPWQVVMCIPQSFRNNQGRWAFDSEVSAVVMLDRLRLLHLLSREFALQTIDPPESFLHFLNQLSLVSS